MEQILKHHVIASELQIVPMIEPSLDMGGIELLSNSNKKNIKAVGKAIDFSPKIVVIGQGHSLRDVTDQLKTMGTRLEVVNNIKALPKLLGFNLRAIVIVESKGVKSIVKECQKLVKNWSLDDIPIFAIVPNTKEPENERKLYKTGVQAVFEWPREKNELPRLMSNMMNLNTVTVPKKTEDSALKLSVRTRLLADSIYYSPKRLAISVCNGVVILEGMVRSFARLQTFKKKIKRIPGVRNVLARSVRVKGDKMVDTFLNEKVSAIVEHHSSPKSRESGTFSGMALLKEFIGKPSKK